MIPALEDFHRPPEAVPAYITSVSDKTTSMAVILPLIPPGPILLGPISSNHLVVNS